MRGGEPTQDEIASCVSKAGTASYLSSNQNAFTSRTAGFIIQQHFPPGVRNTPPGPLVGVGLSNLFFSDINKFRKPGSVISFSSTPGLTIVPVVGTSLDGSPGGVPLYKNGVLVGGVGVTGDGVPGPIPGLRSQNPFVFIPGYDLDEDIALAGQIGFRPADSIRANNVYINGIALPYVVNPGPGVSPIVVQGNAAAGYPVQGAPPPFPYPIATFGGVQGEIRQPIISDPISTPINGQPRLTAAEVASIIDFAADRARITRAGIRLPIGTQMQVFITVVNFPNNPTVVPTVLGAFRTGEATLFSWDVAVQKGAHGRWLFHQFARPLDALRRIPRPDLLSARPRRAGSRSLLRTPGAILRLRFAPRFRSSSSIPPSCPIQDSGTASRFFRAASRSIAMAS